MASNTITSKPRNIVTGKIVQKETGLGIPDLLVVIFDVDPGTKPEELFLGAKTQPQPPGDRLGSVLTGTDGTFELSYDDAEYRFRNQQEQRPDLLLLVMPPEEVDGDSRSKILFTSTSVRQNAGRSEQYLIRLTADQLTKAGNPLPTTPNDAVEEADLLVERLVATDVRTNTINDGLLLVDKTRVARVRQTADRFHKDIKPRIRERLSRLPESLVNSSSFIAEGESVVGKANALIKSNIEQLVNSEDPKVRPPVTGFVALTDPQKETLAAQLDADGSISAASLDEVIRFDGSPSSKISKGTTFLVREEPLTQFCRDKTNSQKDLEAALGIATNGSSGGDPSPRVKVPPPSVEPITSQDIIGFAGRLMETLTSPEEKLLTDLEPPATQRSVDENVRNLAFAPSPADVPAFYDFHNLQIAFEHVWQEIVDEGIVKVSEDAFHQIVELGGNPGGNTVIADPVLGLAHEGRTVMLARNRVRDHRGADPFSTSDTIIRDHRHACSSIVDNSRDPLSTLPALLGELERRLKEDYAFTIYAANRKERSVNFAVLISYQQKWEPLGYQAGRLVKTITLAPRETIKYSKKTVTHRKRSSREVENNLRTRREETTSTTRSEQDIVRKATESTNFSMTSQGTMQVPEVGSATTTTTFQKAASKASDDTKKQFHEAVFKAAQEFKNENTIEVNTEESVDVEVLESGEITNPNDELGLTCLFYELQRCYRVTERIHRITPVVLVAQEVPRPDEIDEAWLITYDWILRRTLLDDSFVPALDYLCHDIVGEEIGLAEMRQNVLQQRCVVDALRTEVGVVRDRLSAYRQLLERSLLRRASGDDSRGGGLFSAIPVVGDLADDVVNIVEDAASKVGSFIYSDSPSGQTAQDALKDSLDRTADEERDLLFRLEREVTALNDITEKYAKGLATHFNHKSQIDRLRIHVKQNILYYMQAIWSHEPPDQRFFRLHKTPVPIMEAVRKRFRFPNLEAVTNVLAGIASRRLSAIDNQVATNIYPTEVVTEINPELKFTTLVEAADLDSFLGFKGNYMLFPLRESNALTDFMMHPYIVSGLNELIDPDDVGNWTLEDFSKYVVCLKEHLSQDDFNSIKQQLTEQYRQILTNPRPNGDEITVPTNSLFIELMPSANSNIEKYKRTHRILDVKKVQAEVRKLEMENVRYAARVLAGEHEDPDIDRKIVVEGSSQNIIVPPDPA